jgi:hypothetical protein
VHHKRIAASRRDGVDEVQERDVVFLLVHSEPALHRHWNRHLRPHRRDALGHQRRLAHQARTKTPRLHPIGRTPHIEIDFVETFVLRDARRLRQHRRLTAPQLQGQRLLVRRVPEQAVPIPMQYRICMHHLGVKPRLGCQQPMEIAAMPVGPIHHRSDG